MWCWRTPMSAGNIDYAALFAGACRQRGGYHRRLSRTAVRRGCGDDLLLSLSRDNWVRDVMIGGGENREACLRYRPVRDLPHAAFASDPRVRRGAACSALNAVCFSATCGLSAHLRLCGDRSGRRRSDSLPSFFAANMALLDSDVRRRAVCHRATGVHQGARLLPCDLRTEFRRDGFSGCRRRAYRRVRAPFYPVSRCIGRQACRGGKCAS